LLPNSQFDEAGNVHRIQRGIGIRTRHGCCSRARGECRKIELHGEFCTLETTQALAKHGEQQKRKEQRR
jgi:hypothetical protein